MIFIHSSVDDSFLSNVSSPALNIGLELSLWYADRVFQLYARSGIALLYVVLFLNFEDHSYCFPWFTFPPAVDKSCAFPTGSTVFAVCFLEDIHSDWDEMKSQSSFNLHFPDG